ncbi:hypothetical protein BROC_00753 [Candidatus Brocadiaceae bacterium]|nr:hypothetical protein BROC_00753 [Candidatus Brocadiaceae bacterium]
MNREKKMIESNIELSAEFSRYLFEHPEVEDKIPMDAEIIFLPEFDLELKEFNLRLGKNIEAEGGKLVYIKVKQLSPKITSRLVGVEVNTH